MPGSFTTIQQAIDSPLVSPGDTIVVAPGAHAGADVTKRVEIRGEDGAEIVTGPKHGSGMTLGFRLLDGADGTTISHLTFRVDLGVMNSAGRNPIRAGASDVTVSHSTFHDAVQAVSNWGGSGWTISHNDIVGLRTRNGGGIGILIGEFLGRVVADNLVAHNTVRGMLRVMPKDGGGYAGTGIVLYADYRWEAAGGTIEWNRVVKNRVDLASDAPHVLDVVAVELTVSVFPNDKRPIDPAKVIHDNAIGFNDLRGTRTQLALTPETLDDVNPISRNLGDNRGHGLAPSVFLAD